MVEQGDKRYSKEPCRKCGAFKVTVDDVDVSDGIDYRYRVDGPDS